LLTVLFLFRMDEDENSTETCEKTENLASTLDTEEVIEDAPRRSSSVDSIHTDAAPEVEAGASEEQQLFCPPELDVEEEDFVVDMAEDCFISGGDAQPSLGMSQACLLLKQRNFCSVADPDPPDPHVFGPPGSGSGSISQRYGSGSGSCSGSGSFYHKANIVRKTLISTFF
jgi:hypothetical protein